MSLKPETIEMYAPNEKSGSFADQQGEVNEAFDRDNSTAEMLESPPTINNAAATENESKLLRIQNSLKNVVVNNDIVFWTTVKAVLIVLYFGYFTYALYCNFHVSDEGSIRLFAVTVIVVFFMILSVILDLHDRFIPKAIFRLWEKRNQRLSTIFYYVVIVAFGLFAVLYVVFAVIVNAPENAVALAGMAGFIITLFVTSKNPAKVSWRPVIWGMYIQFIFACIILRWRFGFEAFQWLGNRVSEFLAYSDVGASFVFGQGYEEHFFAFKVLPVIIFFSTIVSMLYYLRVMQFLIQVIAQAMSFLMGTSPAESLNAAANIFIGQTEAPLMIRPLLKDLTLAELHSVMTGGFATIAGSVMAAYILFGVPANHLLAASVMSAPAALAMSKLFYPETEEVNLSKQTYDLESSNDRNLIDAAANGASNSIKLVANVAVNLIAFLALLAFVNATLAWFGTRVGLVDPPLSFELICSYIFYPMAFMMGTDPVNCLRVAELIGVKTFLNEFVAYSRLSVFLENRKLFLAHVNSAYDNFACHDYTEIIFHEANVVLKQGMFTIRSEIVAAYALCGFANVGSMGILIGGLGALAPSRKSDLSKVVLRAMIAGNVACFMTACIAG